MNVNKVYNSLFFGLIRRLESITPYNANLLHKRKLFNLLQFIERGSLMAFIFDTFALLMLDNVLNNANPRYMHYSKSFK